MINQHLQDQVRAHVALTRIFRCGMKPWIEPPRNWPEILQTAWPSQWFMPPWSIPDGLVEVVMAMCQHFGNVDPGARFHTGLSSTAK